VVRLFARGNGAGNALGGAASATCELDAAALVAHLLHGAPAPALARVTRYDLGAVDDGDRYGFTDATALGHSGDTDAVLYAAAAEASADVVEDGEVGGSALGIIAADGSARWAPVEGEGGGPCAEKVEGVAFDAGGRLWAVVDQDDPDRPSELWLVELTGADEG
jgi:hypothetical protein